jgi:hypothetical protein
MIRKSGYRFSKRSCSNKRLGRDAKPTGISAASGSGRLEIGRLPAGGKHQEQRAIGAITGGRSGFLPSGRNRFSVLIAHLPAEVPAALEDDKFQHRSAKHRRWVVIPTEAQILCGVNGRASVPEGRPTGILHGLGRKAKPPPAFGIGGGIWERWHEAGGCPGVAPRTRLETTPGNRFGQDDFVSNRARVACTAHRSVRNLSGVTRPNDYSATKDVVRVPES